MASNLHQTLVVVGFFFFLLGLLPLARFTLGWLGCGRIWGLSEWKSGQDEGLLLVVGVLIFCLVCNGLMLTPSILEWLFSMSASSALSFHQAVIWALRLLVVTLAFLGFVSLVPSLSSTHGLHQSTSGKQVAGPAPPLIPPGKGFRFQALAVLAVYLTTAQYLAALNYDTALYHYPAVAHFLQFGPELGLANLHFSLGFYNLPLFGQAALQSFMGSREILSPSLNIVFLVALASVLCESSIVKGRQVLMRGKRQLVGKRLIFITSVILFSQLEFSSLASYNADFALNSLTLLLAYIYLMDEASSRQSVAMCLVFLLPAIKLSGVLSLLFILVFLLLKSMSRRLLLFSSSDRVPLSGKHWMKGLPARFISSWPIPVVVICVYGLLLATYLVLSGYLIFPESLTGPFAAHAVPPEQVSMIKGALVSFYSRLNDNGSLAALAYSQGWSTGRWFSYLMTTERGLLLLIWLLLASTLVVISIASELFDRTGKHSAFSAFAISLLIVLLLAVFVTPPNPRFFPWIGVLLAYGAGLSLLRAPEATFACLLLAVNVLSLRLNRPILKSIGLPAADSVSVPLAKIIGWKPRKVTRSDKGDFVIIRKPPEDKCFGIERPCTPYFWFVKK